MPSCPVCDFLFLGRVFDELLGAIDGALDEALAGRTLRLGGGGGEARPAHNPMA